MYNAAGYQQESDRLRENIRGYLDPRCADPVAHARWNQRYQTVRTNLLHFLGIADSGVNASVAESVLHAAAMATDIDHTPRYISALLQQAVMEDQSGVLDGARAGRPYMCALYHTGPYWLPIFSSLVRGVACAVCIPTSMAAVKTEFLDLHRHIKRQLPATAELRIIDMDTQSFALEAKQAVQQGYSIHLFLDGYAGSPHAANTRRDVVVPFLDAEICCKHTVATLAALFHIPIVTAHARRSGALQAMVTLRPLDPSPASMSRQQLAVQQTTQIYLRLAELLRAHPQQWEGWYYFHAYLSDGYLGKLRSGALHKAFLNGSETERFYFSTDHQVMIDRYTLRPYQVKSRVAG